MKKKAVSSDVCPCAWQANRPYQDCCGRYIESSNTPAPCAEALMRSRYSAFVKEKTAYLLNTWHESTRPTSLELETTKWLGLNVDFAHDLDESHAQVGFSARYKVGGKAFKMQETSRFVKENGQWFYVDGDVS